MITSVNGHINSYKVNEFSFYFVLYVKVCSS